MTRDELEYSISQYLDGTLPPLEETALEQRLAIDAEARQILAEYQKLDTALKNSMPLPDLDWEGLSSNIVSAVSQEEAPIRHYSMKWLRPAAGLAVAAMVFIAIGITFKAAWTTAPTNPESPIASVQRSGPPVVQVAGPTVQATGAPAVKLISIGPSQTTTRSGLQWRYADGVVARPSRVIIASGTISAQDTRSMMPY